MTLNALFGTSQRAVVPSDGNNRACFCRLDSFVAKFLWMPSGPPHFFAFFVRNYFQIIIYFTLSDYWVIKGDNWVKNIFYITIYNYCVYLILSRTDGLTFPWILHYSYVVNVITPSLLHLSTLQFNIIVVCHNVVVKNSFYFCQFIQKKSCDLIFGRLNVYSQFIPNLHINLNPLNIALKGVHLYGDSLSSHSNKKRQRGGAVAAFSFPFLAMPFLSFGQKEWRRPKTSAASSFRLQRRKRWICGSQTAAESFGPQKLMAAAIRNLWPIMTKNLWPNFNFLFYFFGKMFGRLHFLGFFKLTIKFLFWICKSCISLFSSHF